MLVHAPVPAPLPRLRQLLDVRAGALRRALRLHAAAGLYRRRRL